MQYTVYVHLFSHRVLLGERFIPGVSDVTPEDCLKQEVLHQLYVAPLSHSELLKQLKVHIQCMLKFYHRIQFC